MVFFFLPVWIIINLGKQRRGKVYTYVILPRVREKKCPTGVGDKLVRSRILEFLYRVGLIIRDFARTPIIIIIRTLYFIQVNLSCYP